MQKSPNVFHATRTRTALRQKMQQMLDSHFKEQESLVRTATTLRDAFPETVDVEKISYVVNYLHLTK